MAPHEHDIQVTVPFAAGQGTYHHAYPPTTSAETVMQDALRHYEVRADDGTRYYFVHDGTEVAPATEIGTLVERGNALRLPLRTETVSG